MFLCIGVYVYIYLHVHGHTCVSEPVCVCVCSGQRLAGIFLSCLPLYLLSQGLLLSSKLTDLTYLGSQLTGRSLVFISTVLRLQVPGHFYSPHICTARASFDEPKPKTWTLKSFKCRK